MGAEQGKKDEEKKTVIVEKHQARVIWGGVARGINREPNTVVPSDKTSETDKPEVEVEQKPVLKLSRRQLWGDTAEGKKDKE